MRLTDMADELYTAATDLPGGVRAATAKRGGVTVTRVEIAREGLEKPRGRYVTLEVPGVSVLDERDAEVIEQASDELRALLLAAVILVYAALFQILGYFISTLLAATVILLIFRVKKIWAYPVVYAAAVAIWAGFTFLLSVRLP